MSALPKPAEAHASSTTTVKKDSTSATLETRQSDELVIAFMGAVGCGMQGVISKCEVQLEQLGYEVKKIKLSEFIKNQIDANKIPIKFDDDINRYLKYQTIGNFLRKEHGNEIFAEFAINRITRHRLALDKGSSELNKAVPRVAYLIDQIKHHDEVKLLRLVYRKLFYLIGVMSTMHNRKSRLEEEGIKVDDILEIIRRDRKESESYGQQLEKAFKLADYFIENPFGKTDYVEGQLKRFLNLIHGDNGVTPNRHEYAMYVAHATGLRSGCLSRQVGASITDSKGKVIAVGANDVPQYGGGLYSADSKADHRCFVRDGKKCENVDQKKQRHERIKSALIKNLPELFESDEIRAAVNEKIHAIADIAYQKSGIPDLIEFSRAVHAEMEAIVSVSRGGLDRHWAQLFTLLRSLVITVLVTLLLRVFGVFTILSHMRKA